MNRWVIALVVCWTAACGSSDDGVGGPDPAEGVRVASFDFAESELLAELYSQMVVADGAPVVRLGPIGPREVVAPALEADLVDVVPEYVGTASGHFGADIAGLDGLRDAVDPRGLVALAPALAEDVNVFVMTGDAAEAAGYSRLSDLSELAPTGRFGGPVECPERPLCLPGLEATYGLSFAEFVPQRSLAVTAEALRRGEIDVGLMFSTAAELDTTEFTVLVDDQHLQPPENIVPLVRRSAIERWGPALPNALDRVSRFLTTDQLRSMNRRVADGEPVADVAGSWLAAMGLVDA